MTSTSWAEKQERLRSLKKPTAVLRLCEDPAARDRYHTAKQAAAAADEYLKRLKSQTDVDAGALAMVEKEHKTAQTELRAAQKAYEACTVTLTFQALERQELESLERKHHADEEDEANGRDTAFDDFAPALIAAASLDGMPADYAREALNTWPTGDADALWEAAWSVQRTKRSDLGKG
ncbi:hypothetical protein [Streptomyces ardesiacus]|uniref:hypothetical protein n=1 Tax=Streptomyces ardesiacus TaxID=285564 RepID=UPI0036EEE509